MRKASLVFALLPVAALSTLGLSSSCSAPDERAEARRVTSRTELIGGPRALGEVGDWLLENDQIRIIVQDQGFSRGFAVFGGSLIDADLVRAPGRDGDSTGGAGRDNFGEMFAGFFLEALEPTEVNDPNAPAGERARLPAIEIENDGSDGEAAVLVVRGYGNDFLALTQQVNEALLDDDRQLPRILFETRYVLHPGARYVEVKTTVQNVIVGNESLTWDGGQQLLGEPIPTPFGDVVLFGGGNKVFLPHEAGYDIRYTLEDIYRSGEFSLPALPGLVADFVATTGDDVSYGIMGDPSAPEGQNYAQSTGQFDGARPHSVHIPFIASAFTGVFHVTPPPLAPNDRQPGGDDEFTFTRYFIVGSGDVASVSDVAFEIMGRDTGRLSGELVEEQTHVPVDRAHVIVHRLDGAKVTECTTDAEGRWRADLPAGDYRLRVRKSGRALSPFTDVTVSAGESTFQRLTLPPEARLAVSVVEPGVGRVPAKVTLVGVTPTELIGEDSKDFLFDLSMGEHWRFTDLVPDAEAASTRRYIEKVQHAPQGQTTLAARPGTYTVFVTRGPEYDRVERPVTLVPGETVSIDVELRRVVDTPGYVASDFHLHSIWSLDSGEPLTERLASYVGEGLEFVVSTDHNFVVDYAPVIAELGYEEWVKSAVGLELTTIDRGHFNGFPLRLGDGAVGSGTEDGGYEGTLASRTFGSVQWARRTPQEIFDALRNMGRLEDTDPACAAQANLTWPVDVAAGERSLRDDLLNPAGCQGAVRPVIVQVNHPRDSILGYFEQYGVDQETLEASNAAGLFAPNTTVHPEFDASVFSWDFDAIEAFNGKRYDFLRNYVVPEGVEIDPISCCPVTPGEPLREFRKDFECDETMRDCACTPADTQFQIDEGNCETGGIAFPGAMDDWMSVLNAGKRVVGTANSDSHEHADEEPGYPRTYVAVPDDRPRRVTADQVVDGLQKGDVLMTNGPFVEVKLDDKRMGEVADLSEGGLLEVEVRSARWVLPDTVRVYRNGERVEEAPLTMPLTNDGPTAHRKQVLSFELPPGPDGFVLVEVVGEASFFPSTVPNEIPPLQFSDVISAFGDSLGFASPEGALEPDLTYHVTPYAMTNPIWVDGDGDGEVTPAKSLPGLDEEEGEARTASAAPGPVFDPAPTPLEALGWRSSAANRYRQLPARQQRALRQLPPWLWPSENPADIRRLLWQFVPHNH